jgi:hypothetical protein
MHFQNKVSHAEYLERPQAGPEFGFIISEHHELPIKQGFPTPLNAAQTTVILCLFIIANNFVFRIFLDDHFSDTISKIVKEFASKYQEGNYKEPNKAFVAIFK